MAQKPPQICPKCGMPAQADQKFCSNCGTIIGATAIAPTLASSNTPGLAPYPQGPGVDTSAPTYQMPPGPETNQPPIVASSSTGPDPYLTNSMGAAPPPPPAPSVYNPYGNNAPAVQPYPEPQSNPAPNYSSTPPPMTPGSYGVPSYAQKPRQSPGCIIASIILLLVLIGGGIGIFALIRSVLSSNNGNANNAYTPGATSTTSPGEGQTPGTGILSTKQFNLKFTYANINITLTSIQQANGFSDDNSVSNKLAVRINMQEANPATGTPRYLASEVFVLILPDGSAVQSTGQKEYSSPDGGVSRANWLDFPLERQVNLDQLSLRVGTQRDNQMLIPLKAGSDLSKYQDKVANLNSKFKYSDVDWTLESATLSYSYNSTPAAADSLYVILKFNAANNSPNRFSYLPTDFMRLQSGSTTRQPDNNYTLPYNIDANTTASGVVAFLMPKDATSFTLIMQGNANTNPPIQQVTQNFQIA